MTRPVRIDVRDGWYHVLARGLERRKIYRDDHDFGHFLELLAIMADRYRVHIHAYVLMDNHYHLLIQTPHANASRAIQWLNVSYSVWYNRRHQRCGPLFQGRFKSIPVQGDGAWAGEVSDYIHLNPVRVGELGQGKRARSLERDGRGAEPTSAQVKAWRTKLREYRWSSYLAYAGYAACPEWLTTEVLLKRTGKTGQGAQDRIRRGVEGRLGQSDEDDWCARIAGCLALGSARFVDKLRRMAKGDRREQPGLRRWQRLLPFAEVQRAVSAAKGMAWDSFCDKRGDWGRDVALWLGRRYCGLTLRELGQAVGADYQAVSKGILRIQMRLNRDHDMRIRIENIASAMSNIQT